MKTNNKVKIRLNKIFNSNLRDERIKTMKTKKPSLNTVIKGILDRKTIYVISQYTWEASKKLGREISQRDVRRCLSHLKNENKIRVTFNGQKIIGFTLLNGVVEYI